MAESIFSAIEHGIEFYADLFGKPYPFSKYDMCFVTRMDDIAMENVGCVILTENFLVNPPLSVKFWEICMHELSHMWFGNLVTLKWWDDLWLNEGFACFMSFYAIEHCSCPVFDHIRDTIWTHYLRSYKYWGIRKDSSPATHPVYCPDITDSDKSEDNFDGITYGKGAAFV